MIDAPSWRCVAAACMVKNTAVKLVRNLVESGLRCLAHGRRATDTGVREHDVEFAKLLCRRRNGALDGIDVRHIRLNGHGAITKFRCCCAQGTSGYARL